MIRLARLSLLLLAVHSCKNPGNTSDLQNAAAPDPIPADLEKRPVAKKLAWLRDACARRQGTSLLHDVQGESVLYFASPPRKGDVLQPSFDEGTARLGRDRGGVEGWLLDIPIVEVGGHECLRSGTALSTRALAVALGCSAEDPCPDTMPKCDASGACEESEAGGPGATGANLMLNGPSPATPAASLDCGKNSDGTVQLRNAAGGPVGSPEKSGNPTRACRNRLKTARDGLVCASVGADGGFAPFAIASGLRIGAIRKGQALAACADMARTQNQGLVCAWTGTGYAPHVVADGTLLGGVAQSTRFELCQAKLAVVVKGHACSWAGEDHAVYGFDGKAIDAFGRFEHLYDCQVALETELSPPQKSMRFADANGAPSTRSGLRSIALRFDRGLGDYLKTWYGEEAADPGYTWAPCHDPKRHGHVVKHEDRRDAKGEVVHDLDPACRFDTMYSWGTRAKLEYLKRLIGADAPSWPREFLSPWSATRRFNPVFFTPSASGSFGYGEVPVRIKLKKDAKFKLVLNPRRDFQDYCTKIISAREREDTIIVRYWDLGHGSGVDYILCGPKPIHSWSFGTKRHHDEIVRDVAWITNHGPDDYEVYYKQQGVDQYFGINLDGNEFSEDVLKRNLLQNIRLSRYEAEPKVFFNPDVAVKDPTDHFTTQFPVYFNRE